MRVCFDLMVCVLGSSGSTGEEEEGEEDEEEEDEEEDDGEEDEAEEEEAEDGRPFHALTRLSTITDDVGR